MSKRKNSTPDIEVIITDSEGRESKSRINANSILPVDQILPNKLNIIPIQGRPVFPGAFTPLMISSTEDVKAVEMAYDNDGFIGIVMTKIDSDKPSLADLYSVGTVARIIKKINLPDGGINIFTQLF